MADSPQLGTHYQASTGESLFPNQELGLCLGLLQDIGCSLPNHSHLWKSQIVVYSREANLSQEAWGHAHRAQGSSLMQLSQFWML